MKKIYERPAIEITAIKAEDIIRTSGYDASVSIIDAENQVKFTLGGGKQIVDFN